MSPAGILSPMGIAQTIIVHPEWVAAQDPARWLTGSELAVYNAWPSETRRAEWLAGRLAAKRLVGETFGLPPLDFAIGRQGSAPCILSAEVPPVTLSLSHSHGLGAATVSDSQREGSVGVDVQRIRPVHRGLCARIFTPDEREEIADHFGSEDHTAGMLLFWALKEAAIKARRVAWGRPLREIEARLTGEGNAAVLMTGEASMTAAYERVDGWWLARVVRPLTSGGSSGK